MAVIDVVKQIKVTDIYGRYMSQARYCNLFEEHRYGTSS